LHGDDDDPWVDVPVEDLGRSDEFGADGEVIDGGDLTLEEILKSFEGPFVVRHHGNYPKRTRTQRLRAQHEKWLEQVEKLADSFLEFKHNQKSILSPITGCSPDVDAPPKSVRPSLSRPFLVLDEIMGVHCKF
jgi:hypothetical protein